MSILAIIQVANYWAFSLKCGNSGTISLGLQFMVVPLHLGCDLGVWFAKASKDICLSIPSHLGQAADVSGFSHLYRARAPGTIKGALHGLTGAVKGCFTTQPVWSRLIRSL